MSKDYYVYVYIDPRNFEAFYYGKGKGSRKFAHTLGGGDSEKAKRVAQIKDEDQEPIIRIIARNLSEGDALLVEKTLLWKLGRQLTNISSGHYSEKFRPHDKLHLELNGFDYQNGIYYYNVGEGPHRNWDDYRDYGFISAGQGVKWRDAILGFQPGDIIAAYLKGHGFVGIGKIIDKAKPIRDVIVEGKPLLNYELRSQRMDSNIESNDLCEYVAKVQWVISVDRSEARWESKSGLYTTPLVRASLDGQPKTINFLETEFDLDIKDLVA